MLTISDLIADCIDNPDAYDEPRAALPGGRSPLPETASARAARERREAAERARRYRERRADRETEREQALAAREEEVARREAELAIVEHDSLIVDALRTLIRDPEILVAIRTPEGMKGARLSLHDLCAQAVLSLTEDVGLDRTQAAKVLNVRLFRTRPRVTTA